MLLPEPHCPVVTRPSKDMTSCSGRRERPQRQESLEVGEAGGSRKASSSAVDRNHQWDPRTQMAETLGLGWRVGSGQTRG